MNFINPGRWYDMVMEGDFASAALAIDRALFADHPEMGGIIVSGLKASEAFRAIFLDTTRRQPGLLWDMAATQTACHLV